MNDVVVGNNDTPPGDSPNPEASGSSGQTAGALLRQARQSRGLHIAAVATAIKVTPRKLELLESDRFDELPDATFVRALAQTVCRFLKVDATPILALLPQSADKGLDHLGLGLNTPFREGAGRRVPSDLQFLKSPIVLGAVALVLASLAVYLLPSGWINNLLSHGESAGKPSSQAPADGSGDSAEAAAPVNEVVAMAEGAASAALGAFSGASAAPPSPRAASVVVETVPTVSSVVAPATSSSTAAVSATAPAANPGTAPAAANNAAASTAVAIAPGSASATGHGVLMLRSRAASWVEVVDGRGASLLSRTMQAGEAVGLDGAAPLKVKIGNASAMAVTFRGKAVELQPTRENVAKFELN